ncbi:hypothetical protein ACN93_22095, partial [Gordonia paraffinivorans]
APAPTTIATPPPPAWIGDRSCGVAWGPDGILDIVALTPGVDCGAAKPRSTGWGGLLSWRRNAEMPL